jgi:hypothetical protein
MQNYLDYRKDRFYCFKIPFSSNYENKKVKVMLRNSEKYLDVRVHVVVEDSLEN